MSGFQKKEVNRTHTLTLLASAVRAAANQSADQQNCDSCGVIVVVDITSVPGTDTITVTIQGKDEVSGKYYTLLAGAAQVATATIIMRVFPGATAAANLAANDSLPEYWRVSVAHSAASNFTYSVGASYLN